MKKIIITAVMLMAATTASAAQISLETAGRCYEATRRQPRWQCCWTPVQRNIKILAIITRSCLAPCPVVSGRRIQKKIRDARKAVLDNAGMEGRMAKSDGYRAMNMYPQEVILQEANKCVRLALKSGLVKL